jgi:hypothetical protein
VPFPWKLHDMLDAVEKEGLEHIVSWQPHGRSFTVYKPREFVDKVLKRFFTQSQYPSFQRQLNLYGFSRFAHGRDKGAYYHSCFVRGHRSLVRGMIRRKIKGTKVRRTFSPDEEPNFYDPKWSNTFTGTDSVAAVSDHDDRSQGSVETLESDLPLPTISAPCRVIIPASPSSVYADGVFAPIPKEFTADMTHSADFIDPLCVSNADAAALENDADELEAFLRDGDVLSFEGSKFHYLDQIDTDLINPMNVRPVERNSAAPGEYYPNADLFPAFCLFAV